MLHGGDSEGGGVVLRAETGANPIARVLHQQYIDLPKLSTRADETGKLHPNYVDLGALKDFRQPCGGVGVSFLP